MPEPLITKPCPCCNDYREWPGTTASMMHNPACIYCGARLIQEIFKYRIPAADRTRQAKAALARWLQFGHDEAEIRRLVKLDTALELEKKRGRRE